MNQNNDFLGTEKIGKLIFRLSLPTIMAQVVNMLYNIVDRVFIGHMPEVGAVALTGVGLCFPILMLVMAFSALIAMGGAPKATIYMGEKNNQRAEKILGNCITLLVIISVILTAILAIFSEKLLILFGASANTLPYAKDYMDIYIIGIIFVQISLGLNAFMSAQGFTTASMVTVLVGAIANIILDPIFIYVFNMGVKGAAWATIISQAISAGLMLIWFIFGKKTVLKIRLKNLILDFKVILPCIALGLAPFIMQATEALISICFNASLLRYGGDIAVGAMVILNSVIQFARVPLNGLVQGAQPIMGYNFGAKNMSRVKHTFKVVFLVSITYTALIWILVLAFPQMFVSVFTSDAALKEYTVWALRIYFATFIVHGVQISCQQTFIALGNVKIAMFLAILRKLVLLLPFIYIFPLLSSNKPFMIFLAEPVADFIAVSVTAIVFLLQFNKILKKKENENLIDVKAEE